jgi:hypothetical protein
MILPKMINSTVLVLSKVNTSNWTINEAKFEIKKINESNITLVKMLELFFKI